MTSSMHLASVPVFQQMLGGLAGVLSKAEAHATAKGIEPDALLQARLFPDMFTLQRQVAIATDFAVSVSARLTQAEVPALADVAPGFAGVQARIAQALAILEKVPADRFEGSEALDIVLRPGTPKEKRLTGRAYLLSYGLPQFFFHVTTAYAILRHNGVEVGKKDYMGAY